MPFRKGTSILTCGKCGRGFNSMSKLMRHDRKKHGNATLYSNAELFKRGRK